MTKPTRGRKCKLTPQVETKVCDILRQGNTYKTVAGLCGISQTVLFDWLKRGKRERNTIYSEFSDRVAEARATFDAICVRTIQRAIVGGFIDEPVMDKEGNLIPEIDRLTGEILRDERGRPKVLMKSVYRVPDARLAERFHQRNNPSERGRVDDDAILPDPEIELEKAPTKAPAVAPEAEHKRISSSLLSRAVKILADQGVPIEGYTRNPEVKKAGEGDFENAAVVGEQKLIEGSNVENP